MIDVSSQESPHATTIPGTARRTVVWVLVAVGLVHSALVMLWIMPVNPLRDAVGQERLSSYVYPYFDQSWSVFAPTPRRGGENVVIRAYLGDVDAKDGKTTGWYDITTHEDEKIEHLVNPSRIHSATRRLGGNTNAVLPSFNDRQKALLGGNYVKTDVSVLQKRLAALNERGPAGDADIATLMRQDRMLTRFASLYARALWGDEVSMVQVRVGNRKVPNYAFRNTTDFADVPFSYVTFGWRAAWKGSADAQDAFDGYVDRP